MNKKKSIKAEIQKLLRTNKEKKKKQKAKQQAEPEIKKQVETKRKESAESQKAEPKTEESVESQKAEPKTEESAEFEIVEPNTEESEEFQTAEPNTEEPAEFQTAELNTEESAEFQTIEPNTEEPVEVHKAEPKIEEQIEKQLKESVVSQKENQIKLNVKNQKKSNIHINSKPKIHIQTETGLITCIWPTQQTYTDFIKAIIEKYGLERLRIQFSKLIFRQFRMLLKEDEKKQNVGNYTITKNSLIKNYSNNYYNVDKSVYNQITKSIGSNYIKINKEIKVPFYIIQNPHSNSQNYSSEKQDYNKEVIKLLHRTSFVIHYNIGEQNEHNDFSIAETSRVYKNTQIIKEPMGVLLKPITAEKKYLSDRPSIGSNTRIINIDINENIDKVNKKTINENYLKNTYLTTNPSINLNSIEINHGTTNKSINQTINNSNNKTDESKYETPNLIINKIIKEATANGSSNINTRNNIINNKIVSRVINKTLDGSSNGIIHRSTNIITNRDKNRFIKSKEVNISPSTQFSLKKNIYVADEMQVETKAIDLENSTKNEEQQNKVHENLKESEIILHTSTLRKEFKLKPQEILKSSIVQADSTISKILRVFSHNQKVEINEEKVAKNIYRNKVALVPAAIEQNKQSIGTSDYTGKLLNNSGLIHCKPKINETVIEAEEVPKNVMKSDKNVYAKSVTSSQPHININDLEVEKVNQIADKVFKILEKRIAIQKDRRGLR